jgi:hypothetical protein
VLTLRLGRGEDQIVHDDSDSDSGRQGPRRLEPAAVPAGPDDIAEHFGDDMVGAAARFAADRLRWSEVLQILRSAFATHCTNDNVPLTRRFLMAHPSTFCVSLGAHEGMEI